MRGTTGVLEAECGLNEGSRCDYVGRLNRFCDAVQRPVVPMGPVNGGRKMFKDNSIPTSFLLFLAQMMSLLGLGRRSRA